ncbi:cholesterol 25-hydroxylase-like protein 2 [Erpetoichthys calabaricus]|uniref:cholesterol 25-hydroxylase-like protein 2 n=1 Tax=Erpetoichthys calabaricus TaxID=27687 RepID=UPI002234CEA8|nr:cholesterol 25-hydroxylase-like protein 2 [Erpetoichthys calabaricus]
MDLSIVMKHLPTDTKHCSNEFALEKPFFAPLWDYLRINYNEVMRSPLLPVFLSIFTYLSLCLFYMTLDLLAPLVPAINRYKIHPENPVKALDILKAILLTLYNHVIFVFPAAVAQWYWRPKLPLVEDAPTLLEFSTGIIGCTILFDSQYYIWHLVHHKSRWLYVTFHATHHEYHTTFCWVTQYMSAFELMSVGFWTTLDPVLLQCHPLTGYAFMVFNVWISVEDHSGYDFPWALHNIIPFELWGGSVKHDMHHQKPTANFQPFFSHWDWLGGTYFYQKKSSRNKDKNEK